MAVTDDPRPVLRKELERVFKNQRVVRAFEKLFDLVPPEFINQQTQIDALQLITELANSQAAEGIAAANRLASAIETLAMAPQPLDTLPPDDLAPRAEPGDLKSISVEAKLIDSTTNLIESSQALTNGAAAAAGTLLNAPAAGNPTKWAPVNDNGTVRYVPLW